MTTNVKPSDLNYDHYTKNKYDRDIVVAIPFHREIHTKIARFVKSNYAADVPYDIVDLGVGTGITSGIIKSLLPQSNVDVVDFSEQMINGAKKRLGSRNVRYLIGDYATMRFDKKYDIVCSVIGIHHQSHAGKRKLFKKIHAMLKPGGIFIFGDLVTHRLPPIAALNHARHYHHLVANASNEKMLTEWAHHHMYLNNLATVEDQIEWLEEAGFSVKQEFLRLNTSLIFAKKQ